jgi:short-subunit dehydrogenase
METFSVPSPVTQTKAIITGASGGIGAAFAKVLSSRYQQLFLVGRKRDRLEQLNNVLRNVHATLLVGDLANPDFLKEIVATINPAEGIDLLVNNAGVGLFGGFEHQTDDEIRSVIESNLLVPMLLTKALLPALKVKNSQIINVGSAFGSIGYPGFSAYSASKFGLHGWTQALSRELSGTSVRVRLFSPRATLTDMNDDNVRKLNTELKVAQDTPEFVAQEFLKFLGSQKKTYQLGAPERLFAWLNGTAPGVVGQALEKKLVQIRQYF